MIDKKWIDKTLRQLNIVKRDLDDKQKFAYVLMPRESLETIIAVLQKHKNL